MEKLVNGFFSLIRSTSRLTIFSFPAHKAPGIAITGVRCRSAARHRLAARQLLDRRQPGRSQRDRRNASWRRQHEKIRAKPITCTTQHGSGRFTPSIVSDCVGGSCARTRMGGSGPSVAPAFGDTLPPCGSRQIYKPRSTMAHLTTAQPRASPMPARRRPNDVLDNGTPA